MKHLIIIFIALSTLVACNNQNKQDDTGEKQTAQSSIDWMGTYECDSIKIQFKDNGICQVIVPSGELNGDYSWDVDGTTICVVDEHQTTYWLQVHEGYLTTVDTNKRFIKTK